MNWNRWIIFRWPLNLLSGARIHWKKWSSPHSQQKSLKCSTWVQSQKWQNDFCFQGKSFNITVIQVYALDFSFFSNAEEWKLLSHVQLFATPWTIQSIEFSRSEYWSGLQYSSPADLPNPGIEPGPPALQSDSLPTELLGKLKRHLITVSSLPPVCSKCFLP